MSRKFSKIELTDICDELSEDLRRELIEKQVICVSKLNSNRNEFNELKNEIKRLKSDLKFANKCLITLNKFKKYLNEIRPQIENVLDLRQNQELNALENEYQIMIKRVRKRTEVSSGNGSDSEVQYEEEVIKTIESDHNYFIKKEIIETNEYSNTEECMAGLLQCDYSGCRRTFNFTEDLNKHRKSCHSLERDHNSNDFENIDPNDNNSNDCNNEPISEDNYSSSDEKTNEKDSLEENPNLIVKTYFCDYPECDFVAKTEIDLKKHKCKHSGKNPQYVCDRPDCHFVGVTHKKLYFHKYNTHRITSFKCKLCDYLCTNKTDLKRHKTSKHMICKCPYVDCGLRFTTSHQRTLHIKRNHKNLHKYTCDKCTYIAVTPSRLAQHKRVHKENWVKCDFPECDYVGSTSDKLKIHKYKHTGVQPFTCSWPQCDQRFHKKVSLTRHLREHKNTEKPYKTSDENNTMDSLQEKGLTFKCPVKGCDRSFSTRAVLSKHLIYSQIHSEFDPNLKLKCNECSFRCDSQKWMRFHMRVHSRELFECQFCKRDFKAKPRLVMHLKTMHSFIETFKCTVEGCHKVFVTEFKRSRHLCRDHKIVKTFPCDYIGCDFVAKGRTELEDHKYTHTGEVVYTCDWVGCGYVGANRTNLRSHINAVHKAELKFECDLCGFRSKSRTIINEHKIKRHTTDTPFKCEYCVKQFKLESLLKRHIKACHMSVGMEYKCTDADCGQVFTSNRKRTIHIQIVHKKKYRCDWPECDFVGSCPSKLVIHKYIHTGETPYVCDWPDCGFVSRTKVNLKHHRYRHTGELPYPCTWPECGKRFRTEPTLSTHMRWHNNDRCYSCEWPGCEFATHDRSHLRNHRINHQKNLMAKNETNKRLKVVIKSNNNVIKKSINKRNVRKPKRYESESESEAVSSSDYSE